VTDIGSEYPGQNSDSAIDRESGVENALNCAALLTGLDEIRCMMPEEAEIRFREWWVSGPAANCVLLAERLDSLPESFVTVHFHNRTRPLAGRLSSLTATIERLWKNEVTFVGAMSRIAGECMPGQDTDMPWHRFVDELASLMRWLPAFEQACEYVRSAFPSGDPSIDRARNSMLAAIEKPVRFLAAEERDSFDRCFLEFKTHYAENYARAHEQTVAMTIGTSSESGGLDTNALRNLEILSGFAQADRGCLERVRAIAAWLKNHHCALPVRRILDRYPRCYCNFLPGGDLKLQIPVADLNAMIRDGVEGIRNSLRRCSTAIVAELKSLGISESDTRQVVALLGQGLVLDLRPRTIEVLNAIIQRQPSRFQFREQASQPRNSVS
jgi:hypothetical protein